MGRPYRYPAPKPTVALIRECFQPNFEAGTLIWRRRPVSHFVSEHAFLAFNAKHEGREAIISTHSAGYRAGRITFAGQGYCVRRCQIIWALYYGDWPTMKIGHHNQNFGDDRIENLRQQSEAQKAAYTRHRHGRSGVRGVLINDLGGFIATICAGRRPRYLGTFHRLGDAIEARNAAALVYHGEFARLAEAPATTAG